MIHHTTISGRFSDNDGPSGNFDVIETSDGIEVSMDGMHYGTFGTTGEACTAAEAFAAQYDADALDRAKPWPGPYRVSNGDVVAGNRIIACGEVDEGFEGARDTKTLRLMATAWQMRAALLGLASRPNDLPPWALQIVHSALDLTGEG